MSRPGAPRADKRLRLSIPVQIGILLLVCIGVYWVNLGTHGLAFTEGHRVIPAWTMLDSGDWLAPVMFEQVYLRKPPGISWAIALSSALLGQTEFAARAVSALACTLMALLAFAAATRWFGSPWGLAAGLGQALLPWTWESGRAAEIEALNNLFTQAAVLGLIALLIRPDGDWRRARHEYTLAAGIGVATLGLLLVKGPAGLPAVGGAVVGTCLVLRSVRPLFRGVTAVWIGVPLAVGGVALWAIWAAVRASGQTPILQGPGEFMWSLDRLGGILALGPEALAHALPLALVLAFPWGGDAARESPGVDGGPGRDVRLARALAWSVLLTLGAFVALGLDNPRYTMPMMVGLAPLAAYVVRGVLAPRGEGGFEPVRRRIGRWCLLGHAAVWPVLLGAGAVGYITIREPGWLGTSGRDAGEALGAQLVGEVDGRTLGEVGIAADGLIEARPEVLLYAQRAVAAAGGSLRVRWVKPLEAVEAEPGLLVAVRAEEGAEERERVAGLVREDERVHEGEVHRYRFVVYRLREGMRP